MSRLFQFLVLGGWLWLVSGCSAPIQLGNGFSIIKMSAVEYRLSDRNNTIIGGNVESFAKIGETAIVGYMSRRYLRGDGDADANEGYFYLDLKSQKLIEGITMAEIRKLTGEKVANGIKLKRLIVD